MGLGSVTWLIAITATIVGFLSAEHLNEDIMIGLAIVNPIYFMCMMIGAMKTVQISLSVILGIILGPIFFFISPEWSILFGGFAGGTVAFFIGELNVK